MENPRVNLGIRAELELYDFATQQLIPEAQQQEYIRVIKQLSHAKAIANLALEQVYIAECERREFFERALPNVYRLDDADES